MDWVWSWSPTGRRMSVDAGAIRFADGRGLNTAIRDRAPPPAAAGPSLAEPLGDRVGDLGGGVFLDVVLRVRQLDHDGVGECLPHPWDHLRSEAWVSHPPGNESALRSDLCGD